MLYTCKKCTKIFDHKQHYLNHLARKFPCKIKYTIPETTSQNNNLLNTENGGKIIMDNQDFIDNFNS